VITRNQAIQIASAWHSVMTWSDPGVAMYAVTSTGKVHSEEQRANLLTYIESCIPGAHNQDALGEEPIVMDSNVADLHALREWVTAYVIPGDDLDEDLEAFTRGYSECALWCGVLAYKHDNECPCVDDDTGADECTCDPELESCDAPNDEGDLDTEALESLTSDAHEFYESNEADLRASTLTMERAGHDFWLTRNRHGAGFWDEKSRGKEADAALDRLTEASHAYGETSLIVGDDGKVGVM